MPIRAPEHADVPSIAQINVEAWQAAYRGLLPDEFLENLSVAGAEKQWQRTLASMSQVLVYEHQQRITGYVIFGKNSDIEQKSGEIYAIYVAPDCWRKGFGSALMTSALSALKQRGFKRVVLWVLHNNERAIKAYEAMGFHSDGTSKVEMFDDIEVTETRFSYRF